jgi:hypothetical protein
MQIIELVTIFGRKADLKVSLSIDVMNTITKSDTSS